MAPTNEPIFQLQFFREEGADAAPIVRTLRAGETLTLGSEGADVPLGDPFARPKYAEFRATADSVELHCFSEARGLWIYTLAEATKSPSLWGALRAANLDASVPDPQGSPRVWVRTRSELLVLASERLTKLSARTKPAARLGRGGVVCLPGLTVLFERVGADATGKTSAKRTLSSSEPLRPVVAHAVLVPLEQRVRSAGNEAELEAVLEAVSFAGGDATLQPLRDRVSPDGPWFLPPAQPGDPPRSVADLLTALRELGVPPEDTRATAVYEVPLLLRVRGESHDAWALLACAGPDGIERAMAYPLVGEAAGLTLGRLAAERLSRWWHDAPPRLAWSNAELSAYDPFASAPGIAAWEGIESKLDTMLEQFPGGRLRPIDRVWRELEKAVSVTRVGRGAQHDAVLQAAQRLAYLRRDLSVLGLVAHELLRRRLDTLTDERSSMRRMPADRVIELVEGAIASLNAGFIGDDNRQKLLNRLAHLLLLFVPSAADGPRRLVVLPSGGRVVLDAQAVDTHERWVREGAVRRGDKRLFESLASTSQLIDAACAKLTQGGYALIDERVLEARARLDAILATS